MATRHACLVIDKVPNGEWSFAKISHLPPWQTSSRDFQSSMWQLPKEFVEFLIAETDKGWGGRVGDKLTGHVSGAGWLGLAIKLLGLEGSSAVGKWSEAATGLATTVS